MNRNPLPFRSTLDRYERQAEDLLESFNSGDPEALQIFRQRHPRFLDPKIPWLPKRLTDSEVRASTLDLADAQLAIARWYDFQSWPALAEYVNAVTQEESPVHQFESAVEVVINGDAPMLASYLRRDPDLVRARSTRVTHFDPPVHRATLLHYVAANGVEGYRQKTPGNIVELAKILLNAGSEVDALANMYGGECTTLSLLVSSCHPAKAGVQIALAETLLDFGASIEGRGSGPMGGAVVYRSGIRIPRYRRGARTAWRASRQRRDGSGPGSNLRDALDATAADAESSHRALALASQLGQVDVVRLLVDAGEDLNRYNPDGTHSHSTPLHQAILPGHLAVVRLLVERGARLDIKDTIYQGTPLGWAIYSGQAEIADYLRAHGAKAE